MATIYKVCSATGSINALITMTSSATSTRTYTNSSGCAVREISKILTFKASAPSVGNYQIYYTYYLEYSTQFHSDGPATKQTGNVTMPAGATSVTKEVLTYVRTDCPI